ncbi:hypothetical protein SBV1_620021 [Verrucomicrobia bacterium]|nr:hypothetical protein SBV1_620021 [Verrucomicrobiota bacterium]
MRVRGVPGEEARDLLYCVAANSVSYWRQDQWQKELPTVL